MSCNLLEVITDQGYIWEVVELHQHLHDGEHNISELVILLLSHIVSMKFLINLSAVAPVATALYPTPPLVWIEGVLFIFIKKFISNICFILVVPQNHMWANIL